jgi:oligopeptide transport system ATP-binding protein
MKIDFEEEPPMFKVTDTHYAATWLLHPNAPQVELPQAVLRLQNERKDVKI